MRLLDGQYQSTLAAGAHGPIASRINTSDAIGGSVLGRKWTRTVTLSLTTGRVVDPGGGASSLAARTQPRSVSGAVGVLSRSTVTVNLPVASVGAPAPPGSDMVTLVNAPAIGRSSSSTTTPLTRAWWLGSAKGQVAPPHPKSSWQALSVARSPASMKQAVRSMVTHNGRGSRDRYT